MMQAFLASYLVNAAWQIPVVALVAFVAARFAGLSPRARNRLWLGFLAAAALLPAVSVRGLIPPPAPVVTRMEAVTTVADPQSPPAMATVGVAADAARPLPVIAIPPALGWAMSGLVAACALALTARLASAAVAARRLVKGARPARLPPEAVEALEALAQAHGRATPPVLDSPVVRSPAVVGAIRPVILMPAGMAAQPDELTAALLHEMAHVVRRDYAVNLACELFTLPVCWHPALIGLKAGVRASRELACDAIAASAMASRKTYARCLVSLAKRLSDAGDPDRNQSLGGQAALAVGLFGRSDLEDRLMHLMKPRETDAPFVGAARAVGLAAIGAGVLGSAALLHVTPVMAQVAAVPKPAAVAQTSLAEAAPPATSATAPPAAAPANPAKPRRRGGMTYSRDGVIIERGQTRYRHTWTGSDGVTITVVNDEAGEPTAEQKQRWEAQSKEAEARAAKAEAYVNSPEFKARIAKATEAAAKAQAMVDSPEFKARIAKAEEAGKKAQAYVNSPEFKAKMAYLDSPEFKARIAKAAEAAAKAQARVDSPEFKARIAAATARAEEAQKRFNSPEFRARMERMQSEINAATGKLRDPDALPAPPSPPAPPSVNATP